MLQNNEQVQAVKQFIQTNGGDSRKVYYALAQQMGVNPEEVLNRVREMVK